MLKDNFFDELTKNLTQMEKIASTPEVSANNAPEPTPIEKASQTSQSIKMSEVKSILGELVKIAEELDNNGSTKAADLVDRTIRNLVENK